MQECSSCIILPYLPYLALLVESAPRHLQTCCSSKTLVLADSMKSLSEAIRCTQWISNRSASQQALVLLTSLYPDSASTILDYRIRRSWRRELVSRTCYGVPVPVVQHPDSEASCLAVMRATDGFSSADTVWKSFGTVTLKTCSICWLGRDSQQTNRRRI